MAYIVSLAPAPLPGQTYTWPEKFPDDELDYVFDATAWLAATGLTLIDIDISVDPSLTVVDTQFLPTAIGTPTTGVQLTLTGGVGGASPAIFFEMELEDAVGSPQRSSAIVALPVKLGPPVGLVPIITPTLVVAGDSYVVAGGLSLVAGSVSGPPIMFGFPHGLGIPGLPPPPPPGTTTPGSSLPPGTYVVDDNTGAYVVDDNTGAYVVAG
jgi:hypothetical protein